MLDLVTMAIEALRGNSNIFYNDEVSILEQETLFASSDAFTAIGACHVAQQSVWHIENKLNHYFLNRQIESRSLYPSSCFHSGVRSIENSCRQKCAPRSCI